MQLNVGTIFPNQLGVPAGFNFATAPAVATAALAASPEVATAVALGFGSSAPPTRAALFAGNVSQITDRPTATSRPNNILLAEATNAGSISADTASLLNRLTRISDFEKKGDEAFAVGGHALTIAQISYNKPLDVYAVAVDDLLIDQRDKAELYAGQGHFLAKKAVSCLLNGQTVDARQEFKNMTLAFIRAADAIRGMLKTEKDANLRADLYFQMGRLQSEWASSLLRIGRVRIGTFKPTNELLADAMVRAMAADKAFESALERSGSRKSAGKCWAMCEDARMKNAMQAMDIAKQLGEAREKKENEPNWGAIAGECLTNHEKALQNRRPSVSSALVDLFIKYAQDARRRHDFEKEAAAYMTLAEIYLKRGRAEDAAEAYGLAAKAYGRTIHFTFDGRSSEFVRNDENKAKIARQADVLRLQAKASMAARDIASYTVINVRADKLRDFGEGSADDLFPPKASPNRGRLYHEFGWTNELLDGQIRGVLDRRPGAIEAFLDANSRLVGVRQDQIVKAMELQSERIYETLRALYLSDDAEMRELAKRINEHLGGAA